MPLPKPNLDNRRFQDIVDEAKRRIPTYTPEWTDHNVSDPGITLIELFAWMTEMLIYQLNRVPEKSYITFLELMGVRLQPPSAASTELTFWLSAPPVEPVRIPVSTEAATLQTADEPSVIFRTDTDLTVYPPSIIGGVTSPDERTFTDQSRALEPGDESFLAFSPEPRPGNAFYFCFAQDISNHIIGLDIDCQIEGIGVDPKNPPLAWEVWRDNGWVDLDPKWERDETSGLNKPGRIVLYLPRRMARREILKINGYWLRCRLTPHEPNQPTYSSSPQIRGVEVVALGGMVSATNCMTIANELLGRSDGRPGQSFRLEHAPVLPRQPGETIDVRENDNSPWVAWNEREHFGESGPTDTHFVLDSVSGEIGFGPAIREPEGYERQYGAIPARNSLIRFRNYRYGGGVVGNVGANTITRLQSAVPYVDRVTNRRPAEGGLDPETLEHAMIRGPQDLRTRFRAVTVEDYEALALEASSRVARARCIQARSADSIDAPAPGVVQVLLVPRLAQADGPLLPNQLDVPQEVIQTVQLYLDERRLLTSVVRIDQPEYYTVNVTAAIKAQPVANLDTVRREALARLYRFLNPLVGGNVSGQIGTGWVFGHDLYVAEIFTVLQGTPGIAYIEQVTMTLGNNEEPVNRIQLPPNGLVISGEHRISIE